MEEKINNGGLPQGASGVREDGERAKEGDAPNQAELEKLVEQMIERRLARIQAEAEGRVAQARSEGRAEAERLAGMSEDERRRYEDERARSREAQLAAREAELDRRELRAWAAGELMARGMSRELADVIDCADAQRCAECIDALERAFREAVQRAVDERLGRGCALPRSSADALAGMTNRMRAAAGLSAN